MELVFVDDIPGYEGQYAISEEGDIWSYKNKRFLKPSKDTHGYLQIPLNGKKQRVHRLLALTYIPNPDNLPFIDHKDTKILNNSLENLRWITNSQNSMNRNKGKKSTSSMYKGVSWHKWSDIWRSSITFERKQIHIGYFETEEAAAHAYNQKATELFGEFALLNVIEE